MSCSRERIADLVDGRLPAKDAETVLAHAAGCDRCRDELVALRLVRGRLAGADVPGADDTLTERLALLPVTAPLPVLVPPTGPPAGRPLLRAGAAVAGGAVLVAVALAWVAGRSELPASGVVPAVDRYAAEHAASTDQLPLDAPGDDTGWHYAAPVDLTSSDATGAGAPSP